MLISQAQLDMLDNVVKHSFLDKLHEFIDNNLSIDPFYFKKYGKDEIETLINFALDRGIDNQVLVSKFVIMFTFIDNDVINTMSLNEFKNYVADGEDIDAIFEEAIYE